MKNVVRITSEMITLPELAAVIMKKPPKGKSSTVLVLLERITFKLSIEGNNVYAELPSNKVDLVEVSEDTGYIKNTEVVINHSVDEIVEMVTNIEFDIEPGKTLNAAGLALCDIITGDIILYKNFGRVISGYNHSEPGTERPKFSLHKGYK